MNDQPFLIPVTLIAVTVLVTLFAFVPPASAQHVTECPTYLDPSQFVWGLPEDHPDGGLAKHAGPLAQSEQVGVFETRHARVSPAGRCRVASNGSTWVEIWNYPGSSKAWVNSDYLVPAEHACLVKTQRSDDGLILPAGSGHAFVATDGDLVAYQPLWSDRYHFVERDAVVVDVLCEVHHWHQAPGPVSIGGHTVRGIDAPPIKLTICG